MSPETIKEMAATLVSETVKHVALAIEPVTTRMDKLERELTAAKSTIELLRQQASANRKEVAALTRRALKKSS